MRPAPADIITALAARGVSVKDGNLVLVNGWNDTSIESPQGFDPAYVVLHDTGTGTPTEKLKPAQSLDWMIHNEYHPVRACHFLISREPHPKAYFIYAFGAYHAGLGGPYGPGYGTPGDTNIRESTMNRNSFGIEHESSGLSWDLLPAQVDLGARVAAALLDVMGKSTQNVLNHKDWTDSTQKNGSRPGKYAGRKVDTRKPREWWWAKIQQYVNVDPKRVYVTVTGEKPVRAREIATILGTQWSRVLRFNPRLAGRPAKPGERVRIPTGVKPRPIYVT